MEPVFDPTGHTGPRDWLDLYRGFQVFLFAHARLPREAPEGHVCDATRCKIYSRGDFHVCAATCEVHYCPDVYTCDNRRTVYEEGIVVCTVSGCAKVNNKHDTFGYVIGYANDEAGAAASGRTVSTLIGSGGGGGGGGGRGRKRSGPAAAGAVRESGSPAATRRAMAAYKRARVCGALPGVSQTLPRAARDAILSGQSLEDMGDALATMTAAADAARFDGGNDADDHGYRGSAAAVAAGAGATTAAATSTSVQPRASPPSHSGRSGASRSAAASRANRAAREAQADLDREADIAWLCSALVRKDDGQTVARRQASREIRWRKVVNEHVTDCVEASHPVYFMLLLSFVTKQAVEMDRWRRAYDLVPNACLPTLREWAAARINSLWMRFRSRARRANASPLKYSYAYHTLAVLYCSATGIAWGEGTGWLLSPIPYLAVLLPSQKDLNNYAVGRAANAPRIEKGVFTHTSKMTRNWLVELTPRGKCATADVDAPFEAAMGAWPPCTYRPD